MRGTTIGGMTLPRGFSIASPTTETDGVVETPNGAHFTECVPDYPRDESFQKAYAASAKSDEAWAEFAARYIDVSEAEYQQAVAR